MSSAPEQLLFTVIEPAPAGWRAKIFKKSIEHVATVTGSRGYVDTLVDAYYAGGPDAMRALIAPPVRPRLRIVPAPGGAANDCEAANG